jgi:hypothetical protein
MEAIQMIKYGKIHEETSKTSIDATDRLILSTDQLILSGRRVTIVLVGGPWFLCKLRLHRQINSVTSNDHDQISR